MTGTSLLELNGIGPSAGAGLFVEVGDIARFPSRAHFASWNGTAPIDASSGDQVLHRLSRAGNRQTRALHTMATVQLRNPSEGRAYYDRKKAAGKTSMGAMRSLRRRLSDIVPAGHSGAATDSSAAGSHPATGTWDKVTPRTRPADPTTRRARPAERSTTPSRRLQTSAHPQPASSVLCLTPARTGAP